MSAGKTTAIVAGSVAAGMAAMLAWVGWALANADRGKNCV